ncbi:hypothetical protein ACIPRL_08110 [Streptomyces sp. NPDC090085]|uniref:hypothetical protein n=1 Tax=Streptomyces sp. NPDC090085 TaxID=3365943 RepID=UPI0037FAE6F5
MTVTVASPDGVAPACAEKERRDLFDALVDRPGSPSRELLAEVAQVCAGCPLAAWCEEFVPEPGHRAKRPEAAALEEAILSRLTVVPVASAADLAGHTGRDVTTVFRALRRLQDEQLVTPAGRSAYALVLVPEAGPEPGPGVVAGERRAA